MLIWTKKITNTLSQKFHVLSCYNEYDTIVLYDDNVSFTKNIIITNSGVEFITTFFTDNTHKKHYTQLQYTNHPKCKCHISIIF
jgi:hypothetical protein